MTVEREDLHLDRQHDLALLSDLGVGIVVLGEDGAVIDSNTRANELFPIDHGSLSPGSVAEFAHEIVDADEAPVKYDELPVVRAMRTGKPVAGVVLGFRLREPTDSILWLLSAAHPEIDQLTGAVRYVCSFVDITAQQTALELVQASERRFRQLAENAVDMIFRCSVLPEFSFDYVNPAVEQVLGFTPDDFYSDFDLPLRLLHPEDRVEVEALFASAIHGGLDELEPVVARLTRRDGSTVWAQFRAVPIRLGREVVAFEGIVRDVTSLKAREAALSFQALHDPLTGLANRASLLDALDAALPLAHEGTEGLAVLYVDLDRFKTVNDSFGHPVGDRVLTAIAGRLADGVRPSDAIGRIGGDEFAAVLPLLRDEEEAVHIAHRLLDAVRAPVPLADGPLVTTASVGLVFTADGDETPTELLRRADVAMYRAKDLGRARVEVWRAPGAGTRSDETRG